MDEIFKRQSVKFSQTVSKYLKNTATFEDFKREYMHYELSKFHLSSYSVEKMRESIFEFKRAHFRLANEFEHELQNLRSLVESPKNHQSVDFEYLFAIGSLHGLAKYNAYGNVLPHMPMLNMIRKIEETEEEKKTDTEEEFLFEF